MPNSLNELVIALDAERGFDIKVWREVNPSITLVNVVQMVNRIFVGAPLYKVKDFLRNVQSFTSSIIANALSVCCIAAFLRQLMAPLVIR